MGGPGDQLLAAPDALLQRFLLQRNGQQGGPVAVRLQSHDRGRIDHPDDGEKTPVGRPGLHRDDERDLTGSGVRLGE